MMYFAPKSFNISVEISPVKAPLTFTSTFCAPKAIWLPASAASAVPKYITGGAIATSQPLTPCNSAFNPSINSLVKALEPFNFQLPITKGRRAIFVSPY